MSRPPPAQRVVLILSVTVLALAGAFVGLHIVTPSDGARLEPGQNNVHADGVVVTPLRLQPDPEDAHLQAGDQVISVAGRSMEAWAQALFQWNIARPQWRWGEIVPYSIMRDGQPQEIQVTLGRYPLVPVLHRNWGTILFAVVFQLVATFVFIRRPEHQAGRILFLSASSILSATTWSFGLQISDFVGGIGFWLYKVTSLGIYTLYWITGLHFALVFPRPLPLIRQHAWIVPTCYVLPYLFAIIWIAGTQPFSSGALDWLSRWIVAEGVPAAVLLLLTLVAIFRQYRTNTTGITRRQIRWVIWAALLSGGAGLFFYILPGTLGGVAINPNMVGIIVLPFPLALAVAILRHNLFDIDTLINRTVVYGTLTACVIGLYVLTVSGLGMLFQTQGNWFTALVATGLVAVLFQPLRDRLQHWINQLMFGQRDEPYAVLARLSRRLENTLSPDRVLPVLVETIAQTLQLPYVAIAVKAGEQFAVAASYGKPISDPVTYPLTHQGEEIGQLRVARRSHDEEFAASDVRLLRNIARQAGTVVYAVQLTADLQHSRLQLVTTREEERRRLRRDLHDGLGPTLAAHLLKIGSARSLLHQDPSMADQLLGELEDDIELALGEIRRLVYNLRPPALDQLGLLGAIQECAAQYSDDGRPEAADGAGQGLTIIVSVGEELPPLPAAVEVAAYRIVQEGLTNVVRHAQACRCRIHLTCDQRLFLTICDDGIGLPADYRAGVGLTSMQERAAELGGKCEISAVAGGGTRIAVWLPLTPGESATYEEQKGSQ